MKFPDDPESPWPSLFAAIGAGQWFRYVTGALEVSCAMLLLVPRTTRVAALGLACTMVGAILAQMMIAGLTPAVGAPAILLVLVIAIA